MTTCDLPDVALLRAALDDLDDGMTTGQHDGYRIDGLRDALDELDRLRTQFDQAEREVTVLRGTLDRTATRLDAALAQVERLQRYLGTSGRAPMPDLSGPVAGQTALEVRPDGTLAGLR